MARKTPTHEPPDFPDEELLPEEPAPSGRQLLRMFIPVALAIVVFVTALMLVLKFLVIPAMERGDPTAQTRGVATLGALQTQQAVTRTQQALTPQATPQPAATPRPVATPQPATQPTTALALTPAPATAAQATTQLSAQTAAATAPPATAYGTLTVTPAAAAASDQVIPTTALTPDPALVAQIQNAYRQYWDVRVSAMADPSVADQELVNVMADAELARAQQVLADYRSQNKAYRTQVDHQVQSGYVRPDDAEILDYYTSTTLRLDPATNLRLDNRL